MRTPFTDNEGAAWTLGVAGANRFPTNNAGGATATNTSSSLFTAKIVQILGFTVTATPGGGATVSFGDHGGTTITGLSFPATTVGTYDIGPEDDGVRYYNTATGLSNVCIKCSAGVTAVMHWRKLA